MTFRDGLKTKLQGKAKKPVVFFGSDAWFAAEFLPCGIAGIDWCLGGGASYGRLGELFGNYSSGKTYLLYLFLAMNQRQGGTSCLIESEFAYNEHFFRSIGGDPEALVLRPARTTQDAFSVIADVAKYVISQGDESQEKVVVGWDGIAAAGTKHLQQAGMQKVDLSKSISMSQGCQYVTDLVGESGIAVIATNQTRERIGDSTYDPMNRTQTPGGKAWPFFSSQRVELTFRGGFIRQVERDAKGRKKSGKSEEEEGAKKKGKSPPIGHWVEVYVDKNKLGPPHYTCRLPFYSYNDEEHPVYGTLTRMGVDYTEALFDFYLNSRFRLDPGETKRPVVKAVTANGWYAVDEELAPGAKKFQAKEWPKVLEEYPDLWHVVYREDSGKENDADTEAKSADRAGD